MRKVLNVAVTSVFAVMVTVQWTAPEQAPLHPVKDERAMGVAVSVTTVPPVKLAAQVAPQSTPAGRLVTMPLPLPALYTESAKVLGGFSVKVAVTAR